MPTYTAQEQANIAHMVKLAEAGTAKPEHLAYLSKNNIPFTEPVSGGGPTSVLEQSTTPTSAGGLTKSDKQHVADLTRITNTLKPGEAGFHKIDEWWKAARGIEKAAPAAFAEWAASNPEFAIKYHVRGQYNGLDDMPGSQRAELAKNIAYDQMRLEGYGDDGKKDGKTIVHDFGTAKGVNNESGLGDFWKIGNASALPGGLKDFVSDNPLAAIGAVASLFVPMAAPALATALGVSPAIATGIINAGLTGVTGGDFKDVVTAGLVSYGIADAGNLANKALGAIPDSVMADIGDKVLPAIQATGSSVGGQLPEGAISLFGQGVEAGQTAFDTFGSIPGGIGTIGAAADLLGNYEQYNKDLQSGIPAIQDQPAGLPQSPTAGGEPSPIAPTEVVDDGGQAASSGGLLDIVTGGGQGGGTTGEDEVARAEREREESLLTLGGFVYPSASTGPSGSGVPSTGATPNDEDLLTLGGYAPPGYGGGTGTGVGTGTTGGQEPQPPEFDITELLKFIPLMQPETEQQKEYNFDPLAGPDLSYGIQKPDYGEVTQRDPLETPLRAIQAPMVTPSQDSGQIGFDEWLQDYTARQDDTEQQDILSMIAGKRTDRGII